MVTTVVHGPVARIVILITIIMTQAVQIGSNLQVSLVLPPQEQLLVTPLGVWSGKTGVECPKLRDSKKKSLKKRWVVEG